MSREDLDRLWNEAQNLDASPTKVAILEEAVRLADSLRDLERGYRLREELVEAATFSDFDDRALVAFSWCLAQSDNDPDRFPVDELLWRYGNWILYEIAENPYIPLEKIRALQRDCEARLRRRGFGLNSYYAIRMGLAQSMGFRKERDKFKKLWRHSQTDELNDCSACQLDLLIFVYACEKQYAKVIEAASPILSGTLGCNLVPHNTFGDLIDSYWALGDRIQAEKMFSSGYRLVADDRNSSWIISGLLNYLVRISDIHRGLQLVERHLPWVAKFNNLDAKATFYSRIANFFDCLERERPQVQKVRIPRSLPFHNQDARYAPAMLATWFREESEKIAAQFDARNGNNYYSWNLASTRAEVLGMEYPDYKEPQQQYCTDDQEATEHATMNRPETTP